MHVHLSDSSITDIEADALVVLHFEAEGRDLPHATDEPSQYIGQWLQELEQSGENKGKMYEVSILHRPAGFKARRLVAIGAGKLSDYGPRAVRRLAGAAVRTLKCKGVKHVAFYIEPHPETGVQAAIEGAHAGNFDVDTRKSTGRSPDLESFTLCVTSMAAAHEEVVIGECIGHAQNFARTLVNEPANLMTPGFLAHRAKEMAAEHGLDCEVLERERMQQMGMGALLGVAQGSAEPPALIVLRYTPEGYAGGGDHLGLIGKGVTFDTGGISIKPSEGMEKMKYDMAGGAAVIGAMQAIAKLRPGVPVTALIPAVENMCGSRSQRPGDIVTSLSGRTIEVLNTDAEGRLILVDAIEYAKRIGVTHIVDAATLTGAVVVALGHVFIGAFTNNDAMMKRVMDAAEHQGEKMWQLPLDEEYRDYLKTPFADLPNIGGRWGGAITAAFFLREWAGDTPWVHLDIAGTAWLDDAKPWISKGPTGICVRTFVELARNWNRE